MGKCNKAGCKSIMEEMTLNEFRKRYGNKFKKWEIIKFQIVCQKCGSLNVEFASNIAIGSGYYNEIEKEGEIIIKCHDCGNTHEIGIYDLEDNR